MNEASKFKVYTLAELATRTYSAKETEFESECAYRRGCQHGANLMYEALVDLGWTNERAERLVDTLGMIRFERPLKSRPLLTHDAMRETPPRRPS